MSARSLRQIPSTTWLGEEEDRPSGVHPIARPVPLPLPLAEADGSVARASTRPTVPVSRNDVSPGPAPDIYTRIMGGTLASVVGEARPSPRTRKQKQPGARRITRDLFLSLGSLQCIPQRTSLATDLRDAAIDPRQAFVLSLVDGMTPIESIVDASPLPMHQVLVILENLLSLRLLSLVNA